MTKKEILAALKQEILLREGFRLPTGSDRMMGLGPIEQAFPHGVLPTGAVHEFISTTWLHHAATAGFIAAVSGRLMADTGVCVWIAGNRDVYPPGLSAFGITADRVIFVEARREKDALWATEEALKHSGLSCVISELPDISFAQAQRLQLAVEKSRTTAFVLRANPRQLSPIPCVARWKIVALPSDLPEGMPGTGFPRWRVELIKVRNGKPGVWELEWQDGHFCLLGQPITKLVEEGYRKVS